MSRRNGFTLLEVLVTITILTLVTYLVASAFPVIREESVLRQASAQITSLVRAAQVQALNEAREGECLAAVGESPQDAKRCSDVGIMLQGENVIAFADTNDNDRFDEDDFLFRSSALARPVVATRPVSLLVEATPPNVVLYVDGIVLEREEAIVLRSGKRTVSLTVSAYGVVEQ